MKYICFLYYSVHASQATISSITCADDGQGITFVVNIPDGDEWSDTVADRAAWTLVNSNCQPNSINSGQVAYGPLDGDQCKSIDVNETSTHLIFVFVINVRPTGGLTYRYDHQYVITCQYNKVDDDLQASFLPLQRVSNTGTGKG